MAPYACQPAAAEGDERAARATRWLSMGRMTTADGFLVVRRRHTSSVGEFRQLDAARGAENKGCVIGGSQLFGAEFDNASGHEAVCMKPAGEKLGPLGSW